MGEAAGAELSEGEESVAGHLGGLLEAHNLENGGGNVGEAAVGHALGALAHVEITVTDIELYGL